MVKATTHRYIIGDSFKKWSIGDKTVDLIVTSPPYPMIEMWDHIWAPDKSTIIKDIENNNGKKAWEAMHEILDGSWAEAFRVLKPGGYACINIGDATRTLDGRFQIYPNHSRIIQGCQQVGFDFLPSIIWRKPTNAPNKYMGSGMLPAGAYVTLEHEHILIMRKGEKRAFAKAEKERRSESALFWEERNLWYSDLWTGILGTQQKLHISSLRKRSAAFPIDLPYRLMMMYSVAGDVVLDPFGGVGTTSLAALTTGRNSISIDIDEKLVSASIKIPTKRDTKDKLNALLNNRLKDHMKYVDTKDMLFFRYRNQPLGIPVKTMQEKHLNLYPIKSISRSDDTVVAKYRKIKPSELKECLSVDARSKEQ